MKTEVVKGQGAKTEPSQQPKDTAKGAGAMAIVEAKKETITPNPLQDRLKRVNEAQKLIEKRKRLVDAADKVNLFEEGLNGEDDLITLENSKSKTLDIVRPEALKKVVELLKGDVSAALVQIDAEILAATF